MSTPFAIQIVGPSGGEWFMNAAGERTSYEKREQFATREECASAMEKGFNIFRLHGYLVRVVNTEDPTEECECEPCLLGEMACAY
jgi:hypothetical protein